MPGEENDDDAQRRIAEEKNGTPEDMQRNPLKYHHLIGSVEQMEQGGFRAKFCIIIYHFFQFFFVLSLVLYILNVNTEIC